MNKDKNSKSNIWLYAVILFTSAFIVLLLTAMSQIKFGKYINDYKHQVYRKEDEKNKFKSNLNIAIEENVKLSSEVESLKKEVFSLNDKLKETEELAEEYKKNYENKARIYSVLLIAQREYEKGNYMDCAELLFRSSFDPDSMDVVAKERYQFLVDKTYKKASLELYKQGYSYFNQELYDAAEKRFLKSVALVDDEYYSDDCYYYLAYIKYKTSEKASARSYIETLLNKYPGSSYADDAKWLLRILDK